MKIWEYYEINNFIWNQQMQKKNTLKKTSCSMIQHLNKYRKYK